VHTRERVWIDKKSTGGLPAHRGQPAHQRSSVRVFECSSSERSKKHRRSEETAVARQCKVEIQEYAVGVEPCDTSSSGFRLRTMQEHAGYTLNMAVTGSLEPHQAVVHYRTTNEVVVAGVINSEMRTLEFSKITH